MHVPAVSAGVNQQSSVHHLLLMQMNHFPHLPLDSTQQYTSHNFLTTLLDTSIVSLIALIDRISFVVVRNNVHLCCCTCHNNVNVVRYNTVPCSKLLQYKYKCVYGRLLRMYIQVLRGSCNGWYR